VTVLGISPLVTPLFMALVVIAVTLLQSPRMRERLLTAARRPAAMPPPEARPAALPDPTEVKNR
jgi:simple sugar transport system permease protein